MTFRLFSALLIGLAVTGCAPRGDALAPVLTITEPRGGAVRAESDLRIVGYAMDDTGIESLRVDGTEILDAPGYGGERGKKLVNFGFRPKQVREGLWRSEIVVTDSSGGRTALTFPLTIDGTPPSVTLTGVEQLGGGLTRVSGVARDNNLVSEVITSGTEQSFSPAAQVAFTFETAAELRIIARDEAGNETVFTP